MSDLEPDEKLCPMCAETIKRAAVKCRYCGSDLPEESGRPEKSRKWGGKPRAEEPAEPAAPVGSDPVPADPEDRASSGARLVWPLLGVLLLASVLAVVFAVTRANADETAPDGTITSNSARAVAMQRAADSTATILSYGADTFDADSAKSGKLMTTEMRADYLKALEPVKAKVVEEGITLKATVVATSLTHYAKDTVRALVFVNQSTTATGAKNEQLDNNRVVVTMKRVKGDWLVSKMDPF